MLQWADVVKTFKSKFSLIVATTRAARRCHCSLSTKLNLRVISQIHYCITVCLSTPYGPHSPTSLSSQWEGGHDTHVHTHTPLIFSAFISAGHVYGSIR